MSTFFLMQSEKEYWSATQNLDLFFPKQVNKWDYIDLHPSFIKVLKKYSINSTLFSSLRIDVSKWYSKKKLGVYIKIHY